MVDISIETLRNYGKRQEGLISTETVKTIWKCLLNRRDNKTHTMKIRPEAGGLIPEMIQVCDQYMIELDELHTLI